MDKTWVLSAVAVTVSHSDHNGLCPAAAVFVVAVGHVFAYGIVDMCPTHSSDDWDITGKEGISSDLQVGQHTPPSLVFIRFNSA